MSITLLDGGMGTMLQAAGLPVGHQPELWNLSHPDVITAIHRSYIDAGASVIYANTFGANRHKLPDCDISEIIAAAIANAKAAAVGTSAKTALDIGPIGGLLEPLGNISFDEAYDIFREVVTAGERAGADLIVFETMSDLYEVKAGVLAAKENTSLPVWVTMTFEADRRTFVGTTIPAMALTLEGLGVEAIGFNCSLGPKEMLSFAEELAEWTALPIILKPNAGLPDPATGEYSVTPEDFAHELSKAADLGVAIIGGCCGTTPEYIKSLDSAVKDSSPKPIKCMHSGVCSAAKAVKYGGVRVIGERINPTGKKKLQQALRESDYSYILTQGIAQQEAGADILDVNVGLPGIDEPYMMRQVVTRLQAVCNLPLQIDSSDPAAIEAGLRYSNGKSIVNSVNGEEESLDRILPIVKKYGASVIGLCMDSQGIPKTAEKRVEIAKRIIARAESYGISREDVIIDCLTLTVSAEQEQVSETLRAVEEMTKMGIKTALGVSNISFGLPNREVITSAFLAQALAKGLTLPIINPNSEAVMGVIAAHRALSGEDIGCEDYISRYGNAAAPQTAPTAELTITDSILKGLGEETARLVTEALEHNDEMTVINELLIPPLDIVGDRYEKGECFLPQLINSANAACKGFDVVKAAIANKGVGSISKGKILIATVKGDIHDIGKNIVKVVLENYGYELYDLGRDVPPEEILETAVREDIRLIGLSALMTTTVKSMAETVALLKANHNCKIWVGGAVLTPEYAREMGADYYAKDAKQSVDIAKEVLG